MLMTFNRRARVGEVQKRLLDVLQAETDWMDRDEIAKRLNKNVLSSSERLHLQRLADSGQIEIKTERRGISDAYLYRIANKG